MAKATELGAATALPSFVSYCARSCVEGLVGFHIYFRIYNFSTKLHPSIGKRHLHRLRRPLVPGWTGPEPPKKLVRGPPGAENGAGGRLIGEL
ncbi:unnamed protein product [Diplocarpon coronariae]